MLHTKPPRHIAELIHGPLDDAKPTGFAQEIKRAMFREVLSMGLPSLTGFLVASLYEVVNMFWLARIGPAPVAAVTMCASIMWVLSFTNEVTGNGSVAVISRRFGEGKAAHTEQAIKATFLLKFGGGTVLGLLGLVLLPQLLRLVGASSDVQSLGVRYGSLQLILLGFTHASYSVYTSLRSIGEPRAALWIQLLSVALNCVLDPILIFGWGPIPELGVLGAAIATSAARLSVVITGCWALERAKSPVRVRWLSKPFPTFGEMKQIIKIGFPGGINSLSFALSVSAAVRLVSSYGTITIALYGMSMKVLQFGIMAIVGLGLGTGALIGQFLGSREKHKAWLASVLSIRFAVWLMAGYAAAILVLAPLVVRMFFSDPSLSTPGATILRIMALSLPFIGLHIGAETVFSGAGRNVPTMVLSIVHSWVMVIPLMYLFGIFLEWGPNAMMMGWGIAHMCGGMAALWLYRRGSWLKHEV
jgi:putative MATE family efflux protein